MAAGPARRWVSPCCPRRSAFRGRQLPAVDLLCASSVGTDAGLTWPLTGMLVFRFAPACY